jgi:hypothetical protein
MAYYYDLNAILKDLRTQDGKLWLRICRQTHWQFNEMYEDGIISHWLLAS